MFIHFASASVAAESVLSCITSNGHAVGQALGRGDDDPGTGLHLAAGRYDLDLVVVDAAQRHLPCPHDVAAVLDDAAS